MSNPNIKTYTIRTDEPDVTAQVFAAAPDLLKAARAAQVVLLSWSPMPSVAWTTIQTLQKAIDKAALGDIDGQGQDNQKDGA